MCCEPGSTHRATVEAVSNLSDVHIIGKLNYDDTAGCGALAAPELD